MWLLIDILFVGGLNLIAWYFLNRMFPNVFQGKWPSKAWIIGAVTGYVITKLFLIG